MSSYPTEHLPDQYFNAAAKLQEALNAQPLEAKTADGSQQTLSNAKIMVSKGYRYGNYKPDAGSDIVQITIESPKLTDSAVADATGKMALAMLNTIEAVRNEAILTSPREYMKQVQDDLAGLLKEAKAANIPGSDYDYSKSKIFDPDFSGNQIPKYGVQLIENPSMTTIRVNIPTNPNHMDEAMDTAKKVAADIERRLPEMKAEIIKRIVRKNYIPNLDEAGKKHLEDHKFEVKTQQQGNWTSVFIDITSPEQQAAKAAPGKTTNPEELLKTNMFTQITDQKSRFKTAARAVLYEGEELRKPAPIFDDVAGSKDVAKATKKVLNRLKEAKPELASRIDAFLNENPLKNHEQWNLPADQREEWKRAASVSIDPKTPDVMQITLSLPKGKADDVVQSIAALGHSQEPAQAAPEASAMKAETTQIGAKQSPATGINPLLSGLTSVNNTANLGVG